MTKTPGAVQSPKQLTKVERDARKAFRQVDAQKAMTEHDRQYLGIVSRAVLIFHIDRARHKREFDGGNDVGRLHDSQFS
jgi:hypothetical protein